MEGRRIAVRLLDQGLVMPYPYPVDTRQVRDALPESGLEQQAPDMLIGLPQIIALRKRLIVVLLLAFDRPACVASSAGAKENPCRPRPSTAWSTAARHSWSFSSSRKFSTTRNPCSRVALLLLALGDFGLHWPTRSSHSLLGLFLMPLTPAPGLRTCPRRSPPPSQMCTAPSRTQGTETPGRLLRRRPAGSPTDDPRPARRRPRSLRPCGREAAVRRDARAGCRSRGPRHPGDGAHRTCTRPRGES